MSEPLRPAVELSPRARGALSKRGGNLFIWQDSAGMLHARTARPRTLVSFDTVQSGDVVLHIESGIAPPRRWVINFTRLPWPHFVPLPEPIEAEIDLIAW